MIPSMASQPEPIGATALAAAAAAAAQALADVARASGEAGLAAQAEQLRLRVAGAARVNALRYPRALAAPDTTASLPEDRRDWEIGLAYAQAAEPPLELARIAADVAELGGAVAAGADPALRADAIAAAHVAAGAARGAVALVATNLTASPDDERVADAKRCAEAAQQAATRASAAL
ncbi:MAG: formiminotransferase-cyclodeaminase [Actinobacteria bacterium]|nr:MAG: formiminotransferase-cyclodeaminase [Actinomycetota bacterium]